MKKYRLKDEKFRKPAQDIAGFIVGGRTPLEQLVSMEGSAMRSRLEEYGIFELWFEEVQPEFKSGDYIVAVGAGQSDDKVRKIVECEVRDDMLFWNECGKTREYFAHSWELSKVRHATEEEIEESTFKSGDYIYIIDTGNIYEIQDCEVVENELRWNTVGVDKGWKYRFSTYLWNIRHATKSEIEKYNQQLPAIGGYKGKLEGDYIIYGCQKVDVQDFRRMYEACLCMDLVVDSITIGGYKVEMETLHEIYEKTY